MMYTYTLKLTGKKNYCSQELVVQNFLFQILELIEKNERLPRPEKCPKGVFELMLRCWNYKAKCRPSFRELATIFRTKPEYINIKHYFKQCIVSCEWEYVQMKPSGFHTDQLLVLMVKSPLGFPCQQYYWLVYYDYVYCWCILRDTQIFNQEV